MEGGSGLAQKLGHCGQRGSEENTAKTSKNGPELYIEIARNILGTAQNSVNYREKYACVVFGVV